MDPANLPRLIEILDETAPASLPAADEPAGAQPDAICAGCSRLCAWSALQPDAEGARLLCAPCHAAATRPPRAHGLRRVLMHPLTYVMLAMIVALLLYAGGAGQVRPGDYVARDADKPWYAQRDALIYLQQAERIALRLRTLDALDADAAERQRWYALQLEPYEYLIERWGTSPVRFDLYIGQARAELGAGDAVAAFASLENIADELPGAPGDDPMLQNYYTLRGGLLLAYADAIAARFPARYPTADAARSEGQAQLEQVLTAATDIDPDRAATDLIDAMIAGQAKQGAKKESVVVSRVATIADSRSPNGTLVKQILDVYRRLGIDTPAAQRLRRATQATRPPSHADDASTDQTLDIQGFDD